MRHTQVFIIKKYSSIWNKEEPKMFRWVHISDIHFYNSKRADVERMREELPKKFNQIKDVDALFITGDFRFAKGGVKGDVDETVEYIKQLTTALHIDTDKVYCVPGNHDLTRDGVRTAVTRSLRICENYTPNKGHFEDKVLKEMVDGFSFFEEIEKKLYGQQRLGSEENIHAAITLGQCNILLLNTALTAGNDDDRQNLLIGAAYLKQALKKLNKAKPTIMLGHHGHSFLEREEVKYIQSLLKEYHISIYLCGHEHKLGDESVWDNIRQYTAGCIWVDEADEKEAEAGYYVGTLDENNCALMEAYHWTNNEWWTYPVSEASVQLLPAKKNVSASRTVTTNGEDNIRESEVTSRFSEIELKYKAISQKKYDFTINGHTLLGGRGKEGIKYYWLKNGDRTESVAFNTRMYFPHHDPQKRAEDAEISAYTTSVSLGCVLKPSNMQCRFCETGSRDFGGFLSAEEIALQNIFMAFYDADCPSFPEVRTHKREFAFMGQGEPGYSYPAVRRAILLTDRAMSAINQTVHRYIISTCGIVDFMDLLMDDVKLGIFKNRVSLHFSLHAIDEERKLLMPIEKQFKYSEFLELCREFYKVSAEAFGGSEKIGVGIMMFKNFLPIQWPSGDGFEPITLNRDSLERILSQLDKDVFRIDLSDLNHAPSVTAKSGEVKNEDAQNLLNFALNRGFEAKTFSSFGSDKNAGCGMLKSAYIDAAEDGPKTLERFRKSLTLLHYAIQELKTEGLY